MRVGITGHQTLREAASWTWVEHELDSWMRALSTTIGVSSLAEGADQLFAEVALSMGAQLEVIIPFPTYETRFKSEVARDRYERLLARATHIETLPRVTDDEVGYLNAGHRVVSLSGAVLAVWDGQPAAGLGGTGDIVQFALASSIDVIQINPYSRESTNLSTIDA
jgi:hypothetical protein